MQEESMRIGTAIRGGPFVGTTVTPYVVGHTAYRYDLSLAMKARGAPVYWCDGQWVASQRGVTYRSWEDPIYLVEYVPLGISMQNRLILEILKDVEGTGAYLIAADLAEECGNSALETGFRWLHFRDKQPGESQDFHDRGFWFWLIAVPDNEQQALPCKCSRGCEKNNIPYVKLGSNAVYFHSREAAILAAAISVGQMLHPT